MKNTKSIPKSQMLAIGSKFGLCLKHVISFVLIVISLNVFLPVCVQADSLWDKQVGMDTKSTDVGYAFGETTDRNQVSDVRVVLSKLIRIVLGFLGIIFLILVIYGGFLWMTAGGDSGKVETARAIITRGIIGLIVILASFGIAILVTNKLITATVSNGAAQ